jgi:hypothetical protein
MQERATVMIKSIGNGYYVSDEGKIYSDRKFKRGMREIIPGKGFSGLPRIQIMVDKKRIHKRIDILVIELFKSPMPEYGQLNHIDGNKENNNINNLEWLIIKPKIKKKTTIEDISQTNEEWKTIQGYDDYMISTHGRVLSLKTMKIMSYRHSNKNYCILNLSKDSKAYCFSIHRLVAIHFIPNPDGKPQVNHMDMNKLNNNVNNLEWVTDKENKQHAQANWWHKIKDK